MFPADIATLSAAEKALERLGTQRFPHLLKHIHARTAVEVDPAELAQFGVDLTAAAPKGTVPCGFGLGHTSGLLMDILLRRGRSVVLLGEAGSGKTMVVNTLVHELVKSGHGAWHVLRVTPNEFLTDTKYIGEWQTRVKRLADAVQRMQRLLYQTQPVTDGDARNFQVVRHYDLGIAPRIKDLRTGRTTNRLDRVFKGHLDLLIS